VEYGISYDLAEEITAAVPGAVEVNGTDENPLRIFFVVDFNRSSGETQDIFIELSKGDVHVDAASGTEKEVIAFGMTNGLPGLRRYKGLIWGDSTAYRSGPSTTTTARILSIMCL